MNYINQRGGFSQGLTNQRLGFEEQICDEMMSATMRTSQKYGFYHQYLNGLNGELRNQIWWRCKPTNHRDIIKRIEGFYHKNGTVYVYVSAYNIYCIYIYTVLCSAFQQNDDVDQEKLGKHPSEKRVTLIYVNITNKHQRWRYQPTSRFSLPKKLPIEDRAAPTQGGENG